MSSQNYQILLFYKYTEIADPAAFLVEHRLLCQKLNLTGRIIVAKEGINVTIEGLQSHNEKYMAILKKDSRFQDIHFKISSGSGQAFPDLSIKVRDEIVSSYQKVQATGQYLTPEQLHDWIHSDKKFYLVDMRNDYEQAVGYFKNSLLAPFKNFRDLPKILPILDHLRDQTIVTVCTGGVRCEKASGFLVDNGFKDVYQLYGGIVSYMEKYPNEDFLGKLYVFDGRITIGFNIDDPKHQIVGQCGKCQNPADTYYDCKNIYCKGKRHFIRCLKCVTEDKGYCNLACQKEEFAIFKAVALKAQPNL